MEKNIQIAPTSKDKEEGKEPIIIPLPGPSHGSSTGPLQKPALKRTQPASSTHRPAEVGSKPKMPKLQILMPQERARQTPQPTTLSITLEDDSSMLKMPAIPQQRSTLHVSSIPPSSRSQKNTPRPSGLSKLHAMPDMEFCQNVLQAAKTRPQYDEPQRKKMPPYLPSTSNPPPLLASISLSLEDNKTTSLFSKQGVPYVQNQCGSISSEMAEDTITPYSANPVPTYQLDPSLPRASSTSSSKPSQSECLRQQIISTYKKAVSALEKKQKAMQSQQHLQTHGVFHNISAQSYSAQTTSLNSPSSEYIEHASVYSVHQECIPVQRSPLSIVLNSYESHSVTTTTSISPTHLEQTTNIRHQTGYSSGQFVTGPSHDIPESTNRYPQDDLGPWTYDTSVGPDPAQFEDPNRNLQPGSSSHFYQQSPPNP